MAASAIRALFMIGAIVGAATSVSAQTPPDASKPADATAAAPSSSTADATTAATPPSTPAAAEKPAGPSADTIKKAREAGLKPEIRKGVTVFCREDANIGSRFTTKKCIDESQLDEFIVMRQSQQDQLKRNSAGLGGSK
jgi:hypothetical protein